MVGGYHFFVRTGGGLLLFLTHDPQLSQLQLIKSGATKKTKVVVAD
jgi:hypothetical protein